MSKDIKKALEHCIEGNCVDCPNIEELGSGETVCRGRLLPEVLEYISDIETKLAEKSQKIAELGDNYARLDEKYDYLQSMHEAVVEESLGYEKEIEQLKQQIVELEEHDMIFHNQLAIEQLEKVKELLFTSAKEVTGTSIASVRLYTINEILDNQIQELKKEMGNGKSTL